MGKEKLLGVQYLRGIAALMVAYFHLTLQIPGYTRYLATDAWINTRYLAGAVPVFFVISGFVMYVSGIESQPAKFVWRRLTRIAPLYWTLTLSIVALAVLMPGFLHHTSASPEHILTSILFIPAGEPLLVPGWSLNYEMFFYGVFALALFAPLQWRLAGILSALAALFAIGCAFPAIRQNPIGLAYTSGLLILFAIGLVLGWTYKRKLLILPRWTAALLIVGGFCALIGTGMPDWLRGDVAPASVVLGVLALDASGVTPYWPWLMALGDASYSLYLAHPFAFDIVSKPWTSLHLHGALGATSFAAVSMLAAVSVAFVTYRLIERPAVAFLTTGRIERDEMRRLLTP